MADVMLILKKVIGKYRAISGDKLLETGQETRTLQ